MATKLFIPITASPVGALLAGVGLACWLDALAKDVIGHPVDVRLANGGHSIVVTANADLTPQQVRPEHYTALVPWLHTAKSGVPPAQVTTLDYETQKQRNSDYYDRVKLLRKQGANIKTLPTEEQNELKAMEPIPEWPVAALINQMSALTTYNKAAEQWATCRESYNELAAIIWTLCTGQPSALDAAQVAWQQLAVAKGLEKKPALPATQVVNPDQGKGANRPKADALTIGGQDSFWLLEYFKFAGLYAAALPRSVQGQKDRKTYVVIPGREGIELYWHEAVFRTFQQGFWSASSVKMDILAALRYTTTMLDQWQAATQSDGLQRQPSDYVDGFAVVSYKDLGSAFAVMNVATIHLPDWVGRPTDAEEAQQMKEAVDYHYQLINAIGKREGRDQLQGAEEQLLRDYRDFLSSRDPALKAFFAFTASYASYALRTMRERPRVRRLSTDHLKEVLMANDPRRTGDLPLMQIVETPGFQRVAKAIRQSTVTQQFRAAEARDNTYEVRYGLADELRRKSRDNREFAQALAEFLQKYSQENSRAYGRNKQNPDPKFYPRVAVTDKDIAQVIALIDTYGAATVANMLVAFGYAREAREATEGKGENAPAPDTEAETLAETDEQVTENEPF